MEFKSKNNQFHSDALTNWDSTPWVQLTLTANFAQLLQFHISKTHTLKEETLMKKLLQIEKPDICGNKLSKKAGFKQGS